MRHLLSTIKYRLLKPFTPKPVILRAGVDMFAEVSERKFPWHDGGGAGTLGAHNIFDMEPYLLGPKVTMRAEKLEKPVYFNPDTYKRSYERMTPKDVLYTHRSAMVTTRGQYHLNLEKEGWLQVKCTLPTEACAAVWLLHDDDENGWLLPEFDVFETAVTGQSNKPKSVFFSVHDGKDYEHKTVSTGTKVYGNHKGMNVIDFRWNGKGTYEWELNGVLVKRFKFKSQREKLNPYLIAWYAVTDRNMDTDIEWEIEHVRILN